MTNNTTPDVPAIAALRELHAVFTQAYPNGYPMPKDAERLLGALPALLDAAERCAFLERVAEQCNDFARLRFNDGEYQMMDGRGQVDVDFERSEFESKKPDLAAYLRSKSASDAGQEGGK